MAFLIGAQKAGTTTLADWLGRHPDLQLADPKEPHFLTRHRERGLAWYAGCFPCGSSAPRWCIDASTSYSMRPLSPTTRRAWGDEREGVAERALAAFGPSPVLYLVRHPADRAYSAYWHNRRFGREARPFEQALAADPVYRECGDYARQIEPWLRVMGRERVRVLVFDDLVARPEETLAACHRFLDVAPRPGDAQGVRNAGGGVPSRAGIVVNRMRRRLPGIMDPLIGVLGRSPSWLKAPLRRLQFTSEPVPPLSPGLRAELLAEMAPSIRSLERSFDLALLERWS